MKPKEKFAIANFKMNLTTQIDLDHWINSFNNAKKGANFEKTAVVLCPPAIYLDRFVSQVSAGFVDFGLQNCFWTDKGAFTGETSAEAAQWMGARYVILGHSERRNFLGETDEMVALKIKMALKARLQPVVCIGENYEQKKNDQIVDVVLAQLNNCLAHVSRGLIEEVIICYEPVWAISANNPDHVPTSNEIMGAKLLIKKFLIDRYGKSAAERVKIIYGGSVDSANVGEVVIESGMDGALIGSASLRPYDLVKIASALEKAEEPIQFKTIERKR